LTIIIFIDAVYSRAKIASESRNNIGKIEIMSVAEVPKDPRSSQEIKVSNEHVVKGI
jgi:hypothetical protein